MADSRKHGSVVSDQIAADEPVSCWSGWLPVCGDCIMQAFGEGLVSPSPNACGLACSALVVHEAPVTEKLLTPRPTPPTHGSKPAWMLVKYQLLFAQPLVTE